VVGRQGPLWRAHDVRALLDRAERVLAGNRAWLPRMSWDVLSKRIAETRAQLLGHGLGDGTWLPCQAMISTVTDFGRTCAACGNRSAEMPQCSRCAGTPAQVHYCSPACQRKHWPAHKAPCKAATAAAAGAASDSR
jgi:hypothetical protein